MSTAVVVGSGPNGLAAAIRLAHAGVRVTVIEAHRQPGGGTRTSERTLPGVLHDDCAAFHPAGVASPYFAALDLQRHGLTWLWPEIDLAHPLDDGRAAVAARDLDQTTDSLGFDAARWSRMLAPAIAHFDDLIVEVLQPLIHLPRHPVTLARFGVPALMPATRIVRRFREEPARALFTGLAAHAFHRLDTPLSSSVGLMLAATAHAVGWPVAAGGTASITTALLAELDEHAGRIVTGVRVTSLDQLREIAGDEPDVVVLDTAPRGALEIVGDRLPGRVRRALRRHRYGPAAFKVDIALQGDIPWTNSRCRRAGTLHLGGTAEQIADAEARTSRGEMPEQPFVLLGQQYLTDPSRSHDGVNPIYAYAHVPHGYDGDATEAVLGQIERFAPGFRDTVIGSRCIPAAEMSEHNANYVGGDIAAGHVSMYRIAARPVAKWDPYRTSLPTVYLCSASTPPGPGVHGMCGVHAAVRVLRQQFGIKTFPDLSPV